jgi:hypothetical protein
MFKLNEKQKILKNLVGFYVGFLLIFSSSNCISSIQAVLYPDSGLGIVSQVVMFVAQLLFSMIIPQIITEAIGFKWTMVVAELAICSFLAINYYPTWYTLIPGTG